MKNRSRLRGPLALLLVLSLLLGGCAAKRQALQGCEYVIGVSQSNLIDPIQIALYRALRQEAQDYPNLRLVFTEAAGDPDRQAENIRSLTELQVNLLIVTPTSGGGLSAVLEEVRRTTPVILVGSDLDGGSRDMFIGPDDFETGHLAGEYIAGLLGGGGGTVLEITGAPDSISARDLSDGFRSALRDRPEIRLLSTLEGDWLRDTAERRMKDFLILNSKVDVVFAHSDAMAYGAYLAASDLRVRDIRYVGVGGLESEGRAWVNAGILSGTFYRGTGAEEAIDWALKILGGAKNLPPEVVFQPVLYTGADA